MKLLKYNFSQILHNKSFTALVLINLFIGLIGFFLVENFELTIKKDLAKRSKSILTADISLSARRPLSEEEKLFAKKTLPPQALMTESVSLYSMASSDNGASRLIQIQGIQPNYPFYGELIPKPKTSLHTEEIMWVSEELLTQMNLKLGEKIKLGKTHFTVASILIEDSSLGLNASLAPKAYISYKNLQETELLFKGSIAWYSLLFQLPPDFNSSLSEYKKVLFNLAPQNDLRITTHHEASEQSSRILNYLNDFLSLLSLSSLILSLLGVFFLILTYYRKYQDIFALLLSYGQSPFRSLFFLLKNVLLLCWSATFISWGLAAALSYLLSQQLNDFFIRPLSPQISVLSLFVVAALTTMSLFLLSIPQLLTLQKNNIQNLSQKQTLPLPKRIFFLSLLPLFIIFWALAIFQSNSFITGSLYYFSFFIIGLVYYLFSLTILTLLKRINPRSSYLKLAFRNMIRLPRLTHTCFIAIGFAMSLVHVSLHVENSLQTELSQAQENKPPSLFIFDLQDDQMANFHQIVKPLTASKPHTSPMIRAKIHSVNDKPFNKGTGSNAFSREQERENSFRNRGVNLSYRDQLYSSEKIIKGGEWNSSAFVKDSQKPPLLSIEERYAQRLGLKIGDTITFDIESQKISGIVHNLRRVKWTSFQPNFFIQFQPGILEMAPKTFISAVPQLSPENKLNLQTQLVEKIPNASIVDVEKVIQKIIETISQVSLAIKLMTLLNLLSGLCVILALARSFIFERTYDLSLINAINGNPQSIFSYTTLPFLIIISLSSLLATVLSLTISYFIAENVFRSSFAFNFPLTVLVFTGTLLFCSLTVYLGVRTHTKIPPQKLLSAN